MSARVKSAAGLAMLPLLIAGCTTEEPNPEPPEPTPAPELKYYGIPNDPCGVIDLSEAEAMLGKLEYGAPFTDDDHPEEMSYQGDTWCSAWFNDGTDQRARLTIRVYIENEPVGEAADQDHGLDDGLSWPYTAEDLEERQDQLPEPIVLPVESEWESSQVVQFLEVSDDDFGWNPEGKSLAIDGTFAESNVWLYVLLWRFGTGADSPPDPEPYAELMADLVDQLPAELELKDS